MSAPKIDGLEIQESLGSGSSGEVFRARDTSTGVAVAVKVSHPSPAHSLEHSAFFWEYEIHRRMRHPNIVLAQRFGEIDDSRRFYVMRYLEAVPLRTIYREGGIEPLGDVALGVLEALKYAHAHGILHGDVKPSNILATRAGRRRIDRVALADFGHAQRLGQSSSRFVQGTLAYRAPEQWSGTMPDARADLYSLGISLYEAIAGRPPRRGATEAELHEALADGRASIAEYVPDLPAGWVELIDALICPNRSGRPGSAGETWARIRKLLNRDGTTESEPLLEPLCTSRNVGCAESKQKILALLEDSGPVRTVLVTGEAGSGKTALLDDVALEAEARGVRVLRADARNPQGRSFRVMRDVHTPEGIRDVAAQRGPDESAGGVIPPRHVSEAGRQRILDALFRAAGDSSRPSLFIFDSLDCADLDSLATVQDARGRLEPGMILCLGIRTETGSAVREAFHGPDAFEIAMRPFDGAEIEEFVVARLGRAHFGSAARSPLDDEETRTLVEWLRAETGGNPGRLEAKLSSLVLRGSLVPAPGGWRLNASKLATQEAAHSTRGRALLALRRMPPRLRKYVRAACVLGNDLDPSLMSAVAPEIDGEPDFRFDVVHSGLGIYAPGAPRPFRFRDAEIARAIAASVSPEEARAIHLRAAQALVRADADGARSGEVAEHFQKAGDRARAREYWVRAARAHQAAGAYLEAGRSFANAWELHAPHERRALPAFAAEWMRVLYVNGHWHEARLVADDLLRRQEADATGEGAMLVLLFKGLCCSAEEGARIFEGLLGCPQITGYPEVHAWALAELGDCFRRRGRPAEARTALDSSRNLALTRSLLHVAGRAELYHGIVEWRSGNAKEALVWHARAYEHALESGARDLIPAVWGNQAICHWALLDAQRALRLHRRAAEMYREQGRRAEAARSLQNFADIATEMGRWDDSSHAIAEVERLNRSTSEARQRSFLCYGLALIALNRGEMAEAAQAIAQAIELAKQEHDPTVIVGHMCLRGMIELDTGLPEAAGSTGQECLIEAKSHDYSAGIAESLYLIGCAERLSGRTKHALACLDEAAAVAADRYQDVLLRVQLVRAEILAEYGDAATAAALLSECSALVDRVESPWWRAWCSLADGKIALQQGQPERASRSLGAAYDTFARLGARRRIADTLAAQARAFQALGSSTAARSCAQQARVQHETLGLPVPAWLAADAPVEAESTALSSRVLLAATEVCRGIASLRRLSDVLARILDVTNTYLGTERGVIALADSSGQLRVRCARNIEREDVADALEISWNAIRRVGEAGEIYFSGDALLDERLSIYESVRRLRIRSMAALPIRRGDQLLGALYVDHRLHPNLFGREEREFLRFIAIMAALGITNARAYELKDDQIRSLEAELTQDDLTADTHTVVGRNDRVRDVYERGMRAARDGRVILIQGPTGSGKDHLASVLHSAAGLEGDFVPCPLTSRTESLIESDLFGVERGAATNVEARPGFIEAARGGTLFLNEIGDLSLTLQQKLLHFLDYRQYHRVGSVEVRRFDGLLVCATNANLEQKVSEGSFRSDLLHRLSGCVLELPPLHERKEDIPDLVNLFLDEFAQATGRARCIIMPLALQRLMSCEWQGNVRELKSCLQAAVDNSLTGLIGPQDLKSWSLGKTSVQQAPRSGTYGRIVVDEMRLIIEALQRSGGNVSRAARMIEVDVQRLRRRILKYGLTSYTRRQHKPGAPPDGPAAGPDDTRA